MGQLFALALAIGSAACDGFARARVKAAADSIFERMSSWQAGGAANHTAGD